MLCNIIQRTTMFCRVVLMVSEVIPKHILTNRFKIYLIDCAVWQQYSCTFITLKIQNYAGQFIPSQRWDMSLLQTLYTTRWDLFTLISWAFSTNSTNRAFFPGRKWSLACIPLNFPCFAKSLVCCQRLRHDDELDHEKIAWAGFILKLRNKKNHQNQDQRIHGFNLIYFFIYLIFI